MPRSLLLVAFALCACTGGSAPLSDSQPRADEVALAKEGASVSAGGYKVVPLVSDGYTATPHVDPHLVNGWGLVASATSPWWVANNGTATSTLYDGQGAPLALVGLLALPGYKTSYDARPYMPASAPANVGYTAAEKHFSRARLEPERRRAPPPDRESDLTVQIRHSGRRRQVSLDAGELERCPVQFPCRHLVAVAVDQYVHRLASAIAPVAATR